MPFDPGNQDISGQIFAQYLNQGAGNIENTIDRLAQINANGKVADAFVRANPDALGAMNLSKDQFSVMSAMDRSRAVSGYITNIGIQQKLTAARAAQLQLSQQQGDQQIYQNLYGKNPASDPMQGVNAMSPAGVRMLLENRYNRMADQAQAPADDQAADANAQLTGGVATAPGSSPGLSADQAVAIARKAGLPIQDQLEIQRGGYYSGIEGYRTAQAQLEAARAAQLAGVNGQPAMTFQEDPVTGARFGLLGKDVLPSGTNPAKVKETPLPEGYGYIPNGKGGMAAVKLPERKLPESFNTYMDKIGNDLARAQGDADASDAELKQNYPGESPDVIRAGAQRRLKAAQFRGKNTVDRYFNSGQMDEDERDGHYAEIGLQPPPRVAAAAPPAPAVVKAATVVKPGGGKTPADLLNEANKAIQNGADPAKVKARLKSMGVETQ